MKKKDAVNYYEMVKDPIDLTSMKNKAKRQEYLSLGQLIQDFNLLRANAELYNGHYHQIAVQAQEIV